MQRTQRRALVTGAVGIRPALVYAASLGVLGFAALAATNRLTVLLGLFAVFMYVVVYGVAKRRSVHGTLVGTIPGAAALVAGYVTVTQRFDVPALLLFLIMVAWQMGHFYAIAIYRRKDYAAAGLPVRPVVKGVANTKKQIAVYIGGFIAAAVLLSVAGSAGYSYAVVMLVVGGFWLRLALQGFTAKNNTKWARKVFLFSLMVLLTFSLMLSLGSILP